jgi:hypothetical protein
MARETSSLKEIKKELQTNGVKSPTDIKHKQKGRSLSSMESRSKVLDVEEVVVDTSSLDEGTLSIGNKVNYEQSKSQSNLSNNLCNNMDQTNGHKVGDAFCSILILKKKNIGQI